MGKGENAGYLRFLPFPQSFQKASLLGRGGALKSWNSVIKNQLRDALWVFNLKTDFKVPLLSPVKSHGRSKSMENKVVIRKNTMMSLLRGSALILISQ